MPRFNDVSGKNFGDWVAVSRAGKRSHNQTYWICRCVCGVEKEVSYSSLVSGGSRGCGCKRGDRFSEATRGTDRIEKILRHDYASMSRRHKSKGFERDERISFIEYKNLVIQPCFFCGETVSRKVADYSSYGKLVTDTIAEINGIDRIDSSKGYTIGNVQPCCVACNRAKNDMSMDAFKRWVERVYHKLSK